MVSNLFDLSGLKSNVSLCYVQLLYVGTSPIIVVILIEFFNSIALIISNITIIILPIEAVQFRGIETGDGVPGVLPPPIFFI